MPFSEDSKKIALEIFIQKVKEITKEEDEAFKERRSNYPSYYGALLGTIKAYLFIAKDFKNVL